jgi:type I restriction enzyme S subunit
MIQRYPAYKDSGIRWVGEIPDHWQVLRGKWLFKKMQRPVRDEDDVVTVFRDGMVTLRSNRRVEGFTNSLKEIGYQGVRKGDLVIHQMDAFAGAIGVSDSDGKSTPVYSVCLPKDDADPTYFAYFLRRMAQSQWILALAKGIRERSSDFRFNEFANQEYPVPPAEEQKAIVDFIERETAVINQFLTNKRRLIELLEEQKQVVINTAVTQGLDPTAPRKTSGIDWLGDIPAHWNVLQIKRCLQSFEYGISTSLSGKGRYKVLTMGHIQDGQVVIPDEGCLQEKPELILDNGDLLFNRTNSPELVGKVGLFCGTTGDEISFASYLVRLKPKEDVVPEYLNYLLNSLAFINNARQNALVSLHQANLNPTKYSRMPIPMPSHDEQLKIVRAISGKTAEINAAIERTQREIELIEEYRTTLIAQAVTGKIDVRSGALHPLGCVVPLPPHCTTPTFPIASPGKSS